MSQAVTDRASLLAEKTLECVSEHVKVEVPARSRRAWQMQHCSCGWTGYPHSDHQSLMLYTMLLRELLGIVPAALGVGEEAQ
jgi:hypothetical protein